MRAHLLTAATAFSLGAGAVAYSELPDAAAAPLYRSHAVTTSVPLANAAVQAIKARIETAQCADAESQLEFNQGECALEDGAVTSIVWGDPVQVSTTFRFAGTWVKGSPQ